MNPRTETNIERTVGRIEGQLEHLVAEIAMVRKELEAASDYRHEVKARLERVEAHGQQMTQVADNFSTLQQGIRDGKMQMRGVVVGIGLAAGAGGAALTTALQKLWILFVGA